MPTIPIRWSDNTAELRRNLAQGLDQIEATKAAADKMVRSLSGENLLRAAGTYAAAIEKIGGAQKLTAANQERVNAVMKRAVEQLEAAGKGSSELANHYRDLARQTEQVDKSSGDMLGRLKSGLTSVNGLLGAFGVALSVASTVSFAKGLLDAAGNVVDLSDATGVSTTALQEFAYVGAGVGVSMEDIARAVGTLSERLAGGDKSATDAVEKLKLNVDSLIRSGPEEAFIAIGDAVGRVEDPMQKNAIAADLFGGKLSRQLIPLLGDLRTAMNEVPKEAVITPEQLQAADDFGDKLDQLIIRMKAWASTQIFPARPLELQMPDGASLLQKAQILRDLGFAEKDNWAAVQLAAEAAGRASAAAAAAAAAQIKVVPGLVQGYQQGADAVDALHEAFKEFFDAQAAKKLAEQEAAAKKLAEAVARISAAFEGYRHIVESMNQAVVTEVRNAYEHGAAMADLALKYKLTEIQASALTDQFKFEALMAQAAAFAHGKLATEIWNVSKALNSIPTKSRLPELTAGANKQLAAVTRTMGDQVKDGLSDALADVPGIIAQSLANSGSIENALKAVGARIGAALGQAIGTALGGPVGGKIGEALGSMLGVVAEKAYDVFTTTAGEDTMRRVGRQWGARITEAMGDQIAKDAATMFNGSRQAAELFNFRSLVATDPNNLGITPRNFNVAAQAMHDVFSMIETGQMTIAQGAKVIDENWQDLLAAGTDAFGFINDQLRELIRLDRQFGTNSKEIAAFLKQQGETAVKATNDVIAASAAIAQTQGELEDLGTLALATFSAAIAAGKTFAEAIALAGPGLQQLSDAFERLGISTDNAALRALMFQSKLAQNNPALIQGVAGLGQAFAALSNMGLLNVETFQAMQRTGLQMYARLQGEVARTGGTTKDALLPMQDYLHRAQQAAEELGIPLDENTQMLIDQSKELGIWKDAGKSATDKLIDGMQTLVDAVADLIDQLNGIPRDVRTTVTVTTRNEYENGGGGGGGGEDGNYAARGGRITRNGVQYLGMGGNVVPFPGRPMGTDIVPTWLTPGERVLSVPETRAFEAGASMGRGGGMAGVTVGSVNVTIAATDNVDKRALSEDLKEILRTDATVYQAVATVARRAVG